TRQGRARASGLSQAMARKENQQHTSRFDDARLAFIGRPILDAYYGDDTASRKPGWLGTLVSVCGCLWPLAVEMRSLSAHRAAFVLARRLRGAWPAYAATLEAQ